MLPEQKAAQQLVQLSHIYEYHVLQLVPPGEIMAEILIRLHDHFFQGHLIQQRVHPARRLPDPMFSAWRFHSFYDSQLFYG